jgi:hypothetical protein
MKPIAGGKEIPFEVTQEQFYTARASSRQDSQADRTRDPGAGILRKDLNALILFGGAGRMPMVKSMTSKISGCSHTAISPRTKRSRWALPYRRH